MFDGCGECAVLWREYASAAADHIRIEDQLKRAALARQAEAVWELFPKAEAAASARCTAHEAIRHHEGLVHTV
jgi:hypothetical protein